MKASVRLQKLEEAANQKLGAVEVTGEVLEVNPDDPDFSQKMDNYLKCCPRGIAGTVITDVVVTVGGELLEDDSFECSNNPEQIYT